MKALMEIKRLRIATIVVLWICTLMVGVHLPVWGEDHVEEFQGVVMGKNRGERAIYVNEMKIIVKGDTEITNSRDVRLSFESLHRKQWVFIRAHLEGKYLVAERIVTIPRYIPPKERWKYRFMRPGASQ